MHCVDTSFLVDYLNGEPAAAAWLDDHGDRPIHVPTVALHEVYRGALRADLSGGLDRATDALNWTEPLPFTEPAARETAQIEHDLRSAGEQIPVADRQIAGVAREVGATLVTADEHFQRVQGLTVERYARAERD